MKPALYCAAALVIAVSLAHSAEAKRPNVLFLLTDDQGWGDAHFAGHPYVQTPNLDRLASQSTWFRQFCKLAGVEVPDSVQPDGEDVSDLWLGQSRARRQPLYWEWLFRVWGDKAKARHTLTARP